jgi:hypothetical protein
MDKKMITCHATSVLSLADLDKAAFTTAKRAGRFIDEFCLECPVMVECGEARPAEGIGTWGGEFYA